MLKILSRQAEETILWGRKIGEKIKRGQIICLFGEMGCGKTTFVRGLAQGLRLKATDVHSPTFTLMNVYDPPRASKRKISLFHFDLYRIEDVNDAFFLEYEEYLYGDGVAVIEWAEKLGPLQPKDYLSVKFKHKSKNTRLISVDPKGNMKIPDCHNL